MKTNMNRLNNRFAAHQAKSASFQMDPSTVNSALVLCQLFAALGIILPIMIRIISG